MEYDELKLEMETIMESLDEAIITKKVGKGINYCNKNKMYAQPSLAESHDKGQAYQVTMPMGKPKLWSYYWSYLEHYMVVDC